jgi:hypothetical protein
MKKTYRIEFAGGTVPTVVTLIMMTFLCLTIVGIPLAIACLPPMYRIVEYTHESPVDR